MTSKELVACVNSAIVRLTECQSVLTNLDERVNMYHWYFSTHKKLPMGTDPDLLSDNGRCDSALHEFEKLQRNLHKDHTLSTNERIRGAILTLNETASQLVQDVGTLRQLMNQSKKPTEIPEPV